MRGALGLGLLFALLGPHAGATTYVVRPDGSGDLPTIQAAIDVAVDGDVIELADGTFAGPGNRDLLWVNKRITLRSQSGDARRCILDCGGSPTQSHYAMQVSRAPAGSSLEAITIVNAYSGGYGALRLEYSPIVVSDCIFHHNRGSNGGGVTTDFLGDPTLLRCTFWGNSAASGGGLCI